MSKLHVVTTQEVIEADATFGMHNYNRLPLVLERGNGVYVFDTDGERYLDCVTGLAVNALGHNDREYVEAVREQVARLVHVSNLYHSAPATELAELLVENSCADRVFFCNSGTEAVEGALKFARKWASKNRPPETRNFVSFSNSFHGRTFGSLSVTSPGRYQEGFEPLLSGIRTAPFNDISAAEWEIREDVCAVIVEPVQGEGGVNVADIEFLQALRKRCDEYGALLIFDEIQCGLGRIGSLFAYQHFGVEPDMITLAKSLAGGLPMGAVLSKQHVADAVVPGDHASTFGGGPLVAAAANVVVQKLIDLDLPTRAKELGEKFEKRLVQLKSRHKSIQEIRGLGLIWGIVTDFDAADLMADFQKRNILVCAAGQKVLRLLPPLIIQEDTFMGVADVLDEILTEREHLG